MKLTKFLYKKEKTLVIAAAGLLFLINPAFSEITDSSDSNELNASLETDTEKNAKSINDTNETDSAKNSLFTEEPSNSQEDSLSSNSAGNDTDTLTKSDSPGYSETIRDKRKSEDGNNIRKGWAGVKKADVGRKTYMAVLPIKNSQGISEEKSRLITDRLNVELFNTEKVNLIERAQIKEVLAEQGFQQSGACTDEECLVEMGQLLGVQVIATGSIGKLGNMIIINMRSVDVATGKILNVVSKDILGSLSDVIRYLPNIARSLVGLKEIAVEKKDEPGYSDKKVNARKSGQTQPKKTMKPAKNAGMLVVKTIPQKADIYLNNIKIGKTPYADNTLLPDRYTLTIKKKHYEPYKEEFDLAPGKVKHIAMNLTYSYGRLTVISDPVGADVLFDGDKAGITPYHNDTLEPGKYKLDLTLEGYKPVNEKLLIYKNTSDTLSYKLFSQEYLDSLRRSKWENNRAKRNARRIIFGLLAAGSWGSGIYFNSEVKAGLDKEKELYSDYMEAAEASDPITAQEYSDRYDKYKEAVNETDSNALTRNILYGAAGIFTLGFVISIPF